MITNIIKINSKYKERIHSFLENKQLYIKPNLPYIDRNDSWTDSGIGNKTVLVYFHSLLIVKDLTYFARNVNNKYDLLTYKIIKNWWSANENNSNAWNEHSVAERVLNFIYYFETTEVEYDYNLYNEILDKHLNYLLDNNNYKLNNHGLMMDRSLLILAYYHPDEEMRKEAESIAISRFNQFIKRDFSSQGIHLENSPEYHQLSLNIISQVQEVLNQLDIKLSYETLEIIKNSKSYLSKLMMPNENLPMVGDTSLTKFINKKNYTEVMDYESGIFVFQNQEYWLYMKNNFLKHTHKHEDLLGILYYVNNTEILVDSGKYNYDYQSEIRKYIISESAHNVPFIKQHQGSSLKKNKFATSIHENTQETLHLNATNITDIYSINRNVIYLKKFKTLIIIDQFHTQKDETFVSNFIFNPDITINHINDKTYSIDEPGLIFKSLFNNINMLDKSNKHDNWISYKFNKITKTNKLIIESRGTDSRHVNLIVSKEFENINIKIEKKEIKISFEEENYNFTIQ